MSHPDDRAEFEAQKARSIAALSQDAGAFERSIDTLADLDRHDYAYLWSWMGAPIIQMPADVMATQEAIWTTRPDVIIETGVARGGSMLFLASMLALLDICAPAKTPRKVIGVDIDIRAHNRDTIERSPLCKNISLIEGSSTAPETLAKVAAQIPKGADVMVILDSNHTRDHVLAELRAFGPLVTPGRHIVAADTVIGYMRPDQIPQKRSKVLETGDEPRAAVEAYLAEAADFTPDAAINGKLVLSSSPGGYLLKSEPKA